MTKTTTRISKVGTVVVPVSDQERAIAFYVDTLGFEKRIDVPFGNGYRWVEVGPADAATTIAIVPPPPGKPTGGVETGIALNSDDIDAVHADLQAGRQPAEGRREPLTGGRGRAAIAARPRRRLRLRRGQPPNPGRLRPRDRRAHRRAGRGVRRTSAAPTFERNLTPHAYRPAISTARAYRSIARSASAPGGSSTTNAVVPGNRWFCHVVALPR